MSDLSILNVGAGDTKLTFDPEKPDEVARSKRIVTDMLRLGYAVLVKVGEKNGKPHFRRAKSFDPELCEYVVTDVPAEETQAPKKRRAIARRVPARGTPAVAVARSAGGMSDRAGSVEMQNLERFDPFAHLRNVLHELGEEASLWAGVPMPIDGEELVIEPRYPRARELAAIGAKPEEPAQDCVSRRLRNRFFSTHKRCDIVVWDQDDGIHWGAQPAIHNVPMQLQTMGSSVAWGVEQEANALQLLGTMVRHHTFKMYLMTGAFLEKSERSGVTYMFRKLRPTVAIVESENGMRILASLCMHPIAYYAGSWAGAMCPTDDVIAHLTLMRGDEALYWRRCNQHPAYRPEAGL